MGRCQRHCHRGALLHPVCLGVRRCRYPGWHEHRRGIGIACLEVKNVKTAGKQVKKDVVVRTGVEIELAKKIVKMIKDEKMKVQASIQGEQVRITGKKRDDLQDVMALLKKSDIEMPLQFENFRD